MATTTDKAKQDNSARIAALRKFANLTLCKEASDAANAKADALEGNLSTDAKFDALRAALA